MRVSLHISLQDQDGVVFSRLSHLGLGSPQIFADVFIQSVDVAMIFLQKIFVLSPQTMAAVFLVSLVLLGQFLFHFLYLLHIFFLFLFPLLLFAFE